MNSNQLITNEEALRLFFNDDVYLVDDISQIAKSDLNIEKTTDSHANKQDITPTAALQQPAVVHLPNLAENLPQKPEHFEFKHLGKNEKGILILVHDQENPVSTPQGTELLRKLVLSINLKNADFALLNYASYTTAKFEHLSAFFSCKLVFSFGVSPITLGLNDMQLHQLHQLDDIRFIFTHHLHQLETDIQAKKTLWGTLKNLTL